MHSPDELSSPAPKTGADAATAAPNSSPRRAGAGRRLLTGLIIASLLGIGSFFGFRMIAHTWATESTDDAFTEGHIIPVAPKVAGQVRAVHVTENQMVKAGDVLVEIDERDLQLQVAQKKAALDAAKTNRATAKSGLILVKARLNTSKASRDQYNAETAAAEANSRRAQEDYQRAQELKKRGVVSPQEFDNARAAAVSSQENLKAAQQKATGAESGVEEAQAQVDAAETYIDAANVKVSQAELDLQQAELQLSYTKITAPEDGRVTRKTVEPGAYLQVGQNLMALVTKRVWVVANFKETQLRGMHPDQPAELKLSAYPDRSYRGHVDSIQSGSGARFSLLPPENATGNFVKVVQRVPVKLVFDEPLDASRVVGPGLSVDPEVHTGHPLNPMIVVGAAVAIGILAFVFVLSRGRRSADAA